jgi:hypothetical protein
MRYCVMAELVTKGGKFQKIGHALAWLENYLAQYCRGPEKGWYVQSDARKDW